MREKNNETIFTFPFADEIIVGNGTVSTLEVINIKESINYGCKGINVAGEGMVVTSNIIVIDSTGMYRSNVNYSIKYSFNQNSCIYICIMWISLIFAVIVGF